MSTPFPTLDDGTRFHRLRQGVITLFAIFFAAALPACNATPADSERHATNSNLPKLISFIHFMSETSSTRGKDGATFQTIASTDADFAGSVKPDPNLCMSIIQIRVASPSNKPNITRFAGPFQTIGALLFHDGGLHIVHGPHYSVLFDDDGDGRSDRREVRSALNHKVPDTTIAPILLEAEKQRAILADRTKSNETRIAALWMLHILALQFDRSHITSASGLTPDLDPTPSYITALHNGPDPLRAEAAKVLRVAGRRAQPAIKGLIHRMKNDSNAQVRIEAALTLGHMKAIDAVAELFGALSDTDDAARLAKIMALRQIDQWELAPAFINSSDPRIREGSLLAVRTDRGGSALDAILFAAESSPYADIRRQAITALGLAAQPILFRETLDDRGRSMNPRQGGVGSMSLPNFAAIEKVVVGATKDEDEQVRQAATQVLKRIAIAKENTDQHWIGVIE